MNVLVTGGTGFVGSALVRQLVAANFTVRILARRASDRSHLKGLKVEIFEGDITRIDDVDKALDGCSLVFNLASNYRFYPFWERKAKELYENNVGGTVNLLKSAMKHHIKRFVHTSTYATIGKNPDGTPSNENTPFNFKRPSHYARSKYLAEQEVLKFCDKGLPGIILNPAIVIGERDYKPTPSGEVIVKFLNRSYPGYFDTLLAFVDVDDVARAHIAAVNRGRTGERYILCHKEHYTMKELYALLEEVSGIRAPRIRFPYPLLSFYIHVEEFFSYTLLKKKPLLSTEAVNFVRNSIRYDNTKAVKELGFTATPVRETLAKAINWYRENGYLRKREERISPSSTHPVDQSQRVTENV